MKISINNIKKVMLFHYIDPLVNDGFDSFINNLEN